MEWSTVFEFIGKIASLIFVLIGAWWSYEKWKHRDEHFPRVLFEVTVNFVGTHKGSVIAEVVAELENKGLVPLLLDSFTFKLLGLADSDDAQEGDPTIRGQLRFPRELASGSFLSKKWKATFVYPGVTTKYNFVCTLPETTRFVRIQADFKYERSGRQHHAAKILKVPE